MSERASAIRSMAEELCRASGVNVAEGLKSESERDEARALYERAVDARELAHRTNQIDELLRLERDHLRPLAQSLSEYARRYHLQIVQCPWSREEPDPNACAIVSGGGARQSVGKKFATRLGLRFLSGAMLSSSPTAHRN